MLIRWIPGFERQYSATDSGRIISYKSGKPEYISTYVHSTGYSYAILWTNNTRKRVKVHRIIAELFVKNPENKPQVNHINGIKTDNQANNLEWVTASENIKHAYDLGLLKPRKGDKHHKHDKTIYTFRHPDYGTVQCTQFELRTKYDLTQANLSQVIRKIRKTCKGWVLV